jgi:hypothetical protein
MFADKDDDEPFMPKPAAKPAAKKAAKPAGDKPKGRAKKGKQNYLYLSTTCSVYILYRHLVLNNVI